MKLSLLKSIVIAIFMSSAISAQADVITSSAIHEFEDPTAMDTSFLAEQHYKYSFEGSADAIIRFDSRTLGNLASEDVTVKTHVPESGSIILFAVGLFSLVMARRKTKS